MSGTWWHVALAVLVAMTAVWLVFVVALVVARPRGGLLRESLRILPDLVRLLTRLARDPDLPRGVRVRLGLLLGYLALPVDLVPDFVPVLGYTDDAIVVVLALRSVVRRVGVEPLRAHWPGTEDGFTTLCRLARLPDSRTPEPG